MSFLRAPNRERFVSRGNRPKAIKFGSAKLGRGRQLPTTTAADRAGVERHRVVTRTDQEMSGEISHRSHNHLEPKLVVQPRPQAGLSFRKSIYLLR